MTTLAMQNLGDAIQRTAPQYPSAYYVWPWPVGGMWIVRRAGRPTAAFARRPDALDFSRAMNDRLFNRRLRNA